MSAVCFMHSPAECRSRAVECLALAEKERPGARALLLEIAETWLRLAASVEEQERLVSAQPEMPTKKKLT